MGREPNPSRRFASGFTLIELLVVVAIIALLISILLPSLGRARAQARATQCASRISQMAKSLLLYSEDFKEAPPFMGRGWEDHDEVLNSTEEWPKHSGITVRQWGMWENWIMPDMPEYWATEQSTWPAKAQLRNGSLYQYARFDTVYRCPEFERTAPGIKSQNVFNYCRSVVARKWFLPDEPEAQSGSDYSTGSMFGAPGPIVPMSSIYAPSDAWLLIEEQWNYHVGAPIDQFAPPAHTIGTGGWMAADCMFFPLGSELGQYHGTQVKPPAPPYAGGVAVPAVQRGMIAYYDGHATLELDILPGRNVNSLDALTQYPYILDWMLGRIFSVRGRYINFQLP
jgi:prepilin-type N-terminal cleavage/methylation domain-containing protein